MISFIVAALSMVACTLGVYQLFKKERNIDKRIGLSSIQIMLITIAIALQIVVIIMEITSVINWIALTVLVIWLTFEVLTQSILIAKKIEIDMEDRVD